MVSLLSYPRKIPPVTEFAVHDLSTPSRLKAKSPLLKNRGLWCRRLTTNCMMSYAPAVQRASTRLLISMCTGRRSRPLFSRHFTSLCPIRNSRSALFIRLPAGNTQPASAYTSGSRTPIAWPARSWCTLISDLSSTPPQRFRLATDHTRFLSSVHSSRNV